MSATKTAVLVHGGWHGGWCWSRVAKHLRAEGWDVFAPSLTGLGDRAHLANPEVDLETHVLDVVNLIEAEELEGVVLAGHSGGGSVVTAAADRVADRLAGLFYLDASMPMSGQSVLDFLGNEQGIADLFRTQAAEGGDGWRIPAGLPFDASGFGVEDADDQAWVNRHLTDHPLAAFADPLELTGAWERVPKKTYIRCEQFRVAHGEPTIAKYEENPAWHTERWDCNHSPNITDPRRVAAAIAVAG